MNPLVVLLLAIVFIVVAIAVLRLHAFIVLLLAAFFVGLAAVPRGPGGAAGTVELALREFGAAVGQIGFIIALASIIGVFLMESGAADKIVRRLLAWCGESRASVALMLAGFILAVPVFFDTVFLLLIPLARALALRTGKNYLLYVMAVGCGGTLTHSLVPPTPGPLAAAEFLQLDLATTMLAGIAAALPVAFVLLGLAAWMDRRRPIPLRETRDATLEELRARGVRAEAELPGFFVSLLPIALPVVLISTAAVLGSLGAAAGGAARPALDFLGNKNVAMLLGTAAAAALWLTRQPRGARHLGAKLQAPLETAGVIILITGAGGSFGGMIKHAGVGPELQALAESWNIGLIPLAWGLTWLIRAAQGSATVAMVTAATLMAAMIGDGSDLPYHPVYIFLAIGFGSKSITWMNDSGFWVVSKMSGFTEGETLRTWTVLLLVASVLGLVEVLVLAKLLPFVG